MAICSSTLAECTHARRLLCANLYERQSLQAREFTQGRRKVTCAERNVVSGRFGAPGIDKLSRRQAKANAAIGVANLENRARDGFTFGGEKFKGARTRLRAAEDGDGAEFDVELDRDAIAGFTVIKAEAAQ